MGTTITGLLRNVFIFIDSIVYGLIGKVYELLIDIANTSIISGDTIDKFADRVYALLAVFMLFKLSFSILTYIINPDSSTDKSTGTGKLIGNILITIVLLISVPWCFDQVWKIQTSILSDNIIGKIILGTNGADDESIATQFNAGDEMAWTTFSAFFYPDIEGCSNPDSNDCDSALKAIEFEAGETKTNVASAYSRIKKSKLVSGIKNSGLVNSQTSDKKFVFEYMPLISTIAGGFIVYILILFCIQIAVRSVKLGVLQLIAPIPVISYLDPKQGKDGMFKKWLKLCGKTFADLFIRLAAIYFAVFIISEITSGSMTDVITGQEQTSVLVKVLVILGALTFAKELPKFIEEITGIKLDGGFSLNPMKSAALGGLLGGVVGAGMGIAGAATGAGIGGVFTGAAKGARSGFGGKKFSEISSSQASRNAQMRTARLNESSFAGRMGARVGNVLGTGGELASIEREKSIEQDAIKQIDNSIKGLEDQKKAIQGTDAYIQRQRALKDQKAVADSIKAMEERAKSEIAAGKGGVIGAEYLKRKATAEYLKNNIGNVGLDGKTKITSEMAANAEASMNDYLNGKGMKDYMTQASAGAIDDATFSNLRATAEVAASNIGETLSMDGSTIHTQLGTAKGNAGNLERAGNADDRAIAEFDAQISALNREKAPHNDRIRELDRREVVAKANKDAIGGK